MGRKLNKSSIMATASEDAMQLEEKKRKWQDSNEDVKYVCDGGKVQCKYCSSPVAQIKVTAESIMLQDKPWATVGDNNGQINFGFTGLCTHPKWGNNKPSCKSVISLGQWQDFSETVIGNHHALLVKSTIPCLISGEKLQIVHSGQTATLDVVNPLDKRKVLEDAYWIDGEEERRDIPLNTTVGLYIKARNVCVGEDISLNFKDERGKNRTYIGKVINDNTIFIDNFMINSDNE